jgi:hypothetical protein
MPRTFGHNAGHAASNIFNAQRGRESVDQLVVAARHRAGDAMNGNKRDTPVSPEILQLLMAQFPGRLALDRTETARALGFKNAITVDRLRQRGLLRASVATRRPTYPLTEIARFLAETSEGL